MPWIESHTVLIRHRKVKDLSRELRIRPAYSVGHLHVLWHAALEQAEDGDLSSWSDEFIAESADYPGDAPQFVRLLQKHRWLDGKVIHDWLDYAGLYLTRKYSTSNRERLVEIWKKHGREYGANGKRADSEQRLLAPVPTNLPTLTNQPEKGEVGSLSLPPSAPPPEDPNRWPQSKQPAPKPTREAITRERIGTIHEWYCTMTSEQPLSQTIERQWYEFLKTFTEDDFKRVFSYLRNQIAIEKRNPGALKLSNILQSDKFAEDLVIAKTNMRKPMPQKAAQGQSKPNEQGKALLPKLTQGMREAIEKGEK